MAFRESEGVSMPRTVDTVAESAIGGNYHNLPKGYFRSANFIGSFIGVMLMAQSVYGAYVLPATTLAIINADLGPSTNSVLILTINTITSGCLLTVVGRLGDIFGRRYLLIGGQVFGVLGSIIGATAQSVNVLIGSSVFTGIAAAVQMTFTFVISELVPNKYRTYVNAALFTSIIPFSAMGPVVVELGFLCNTLQRVGGISFCATVLISSLPLVRWFYYMNIITCGSSVVVLALFCFPPNYQQLHTHTSKYEQFKKIDFVGLVLFSGGVLLLMLGLSFGGSSYPWVSGHGLGFILVGASCVISFILYENWARLEAPLLPMKLFKNQNYVAISSIACVASMIMVSSGVIWPTQITSLSFATGNVGIGLLSCTEAAGAALGVVMAGILFMRIGRAKYQLLGCCVGMTVFTAGLAAADQYHKSLAIAFTLLGGICAGFLLIVTSTMVGLVCDPGDIGLASGFLASLQQIFGTVATTIYVTILDNRLKDNLPADVIPADISAGLQKSALPALFEAITLGTPAAFTKVPGITPTILRAVSGAVHDAYFASFKTVYLVTIVFGALACIAALFSQSIDDKLTDQVARKMRGIKNPTPVGGGEDIEKTSYLGHLTPLEPLQLEFRWITVDHVVLSLS